MLVNGHDLHVEQYGPPNGPDIMLLHHGLGSTKAWQNQIPDLVAAGYRVVAYDRWGYGGAQPRAGLDIPTFRSDSDDLLKLLDQLEIRRAVLIGHSDGGTLALYFAAQYPDRVIGLVCIAAHIYVEPKMEQGIQEVRQAFERDEHFRKGMQLAHGDKYEAVFRNWYEGWYRAENLGWDMRTILKQIRCPALIVQGQEDEHATPQQVEDIASGIPRAKLWLIPRVGHMVPQQAAGAFNARLVEFLHLCTKDVQ